MWHQLRAFCSEVASDQRVRAVVLTGAGDHFCAGGDITEFETRIATLGRDHGIPGFSAAIVSDGRIVWAKGFGVADVQTGAAATPETLYHLASLTKTFASTVIQQLVDEGKVGLDDPVSSYGISLGGQGIVRVRHLLTMTSEGVPGSAYSYNGDRFGLLDSVIARGSGQPFARALTERILVPAQLSRTAANPLNTASFALAGLDPALVQAKLARGYSVNAQNSASPIAYPSYFGSAAGMISSTTDIATYSIALDGTLLLSAQAKERAFTPTKSTGGDTLPYAMGWFSQDYFGEKVVWHYGLWIGNSSILVRVPARGLTFVILANSDGLASRANLGGGKLLSSPFATEFLRAFVEAGLHIPAT